MKKIIIIAALLALSTTTRAADFSTPVLAPDGTPVTDNFGKSLELTVGKVCVNALNADYKDEQIDGVEKMRRWSLAKNIFEHPDYHLTSDETALVKKLVAKMYPPLIVGPAWQVLEPEAK